MTIPATPRELVFRDRIVTILSAITAGATYFYTPKVKKRFIHWSEYRGAYPLYMVTFGSGGPRELHSHNTIEATVSISIKGIVQDNEDTTAKIAKCWQDIRVALTAEMENSDAAALPSLGVETCRCKDFPDTDDGYLAVENGLGFFDMRVEIRFFDTLGYL